MGLSTLVLEIIEPPTEDFNCLEEIEEFCKKNLYGYHFTESCPAILETKFTKDVSIYVLDVEETCKLFNIDLNKYNFIGQLGCSYVFLNKDYESNQDEDIENFDKNSIKIEIDKCQYKLEQTKCFFTGNIISSMNSGANPQFYEDGKWTTDTVVIDKDTLMHNFEMYFNDPQYGKPIEFKKHIIDKFVEGKHIVAYW